MFMDFEIIANLNERDLIGLNMFMHSGMLSYSNTYY